MSEYDFNNNRSESNELASSEQNDVLYGTVQPRSPKKKGGLKIVALALCAALACGAAGYFIGNRGTTQQAAAPAETPAQTQEAAASDPGQTESSSSGSFSLATSLTNSTGRTELTVAELVKQYKDTTVLVTSISKATNSGYGFSFGGGYFFGGNGGGQEQTETSLGSGVIVSADGYIITNNHVVEGASSVKVTLSDNTTYDAQVVGTDEQTDIAVLKISATGLKYATLGDSDQIEVGQTCVAIGNPLGNLTGTVTSGIISALERTITVENQTMTLLQHDAAINEGNSGGPLFNLYGEVIGINNAKTSALGVEGIGFAIPSNTVKEVAEDLINNGYVTGRPKIGISVQTISEAQAQYYGVVAGVGVVSVETGSPAEEAGLTAGDIITAMNGQTVQTLDDLDAVKNSCKVGDSVSVEVYRNGQTVKLTLVLGEDKPEATPAAYNGGWNTQG